jgi:nucleotide-binding universal stress UspA family protein
MASQPFGPVVVGVDGSGASLAAVELAAEEAMARVAPLTVVHVRGESVRYGGGHVEAPEEARRVVALAVGRAQSEHPGLSVTARLVPGEPAAVLADLSRGASLLVVGHRGSGTAPGRSIAARVVRRAQVPVIVHRPLDDAHAVTLPRPVLVGVDEARSEPAVEFAFAEAALRGTSLLAVHVWSCPGDTGPIQSGPFGYDFTRAHDEADALLTEALWRWARKYPEVRVHRAVRHSLDVPVALTAASRAVQLAVIGSGRLDPARPLPGSAFQALLYRGGCPIAVVPTG